jgi:hypothetical protein
MKLINKQLLVLPFLALFALISYAETPASDDKAAATAAPEAQGAAPAPEENANAANSPAAGSKFSKLKVGMHIDEVQEIMGRVHDRQHAYESGKRWIPFYFGNDARRLQVLYKGEGCLTYTEGNQFGGGAGELIFIESDPSGACYR